MRHIDNMHNTLTFKALSPGGWGGVFGPPLMSIISISDARMFGIYVLVYKSSFQICHLNLYQPHSITMATIYMGTFLFK